MLKYPSDKESDGITAQALGNNIAYGSITITNHVRSSSLNILQKNVCSSLFLLQISFNTSY